MTARETAHAHASSSRAWRRLSRILGSVASSVALVAATLALGANASAAALRTAVPPVPPVPVVSVTFDDGNSDQLLGADILDRYDLDGTFYVQSGVIDTPGFLTADDLHRLQRAGHEIGSHTVGHVDLSTVSRGEAIRQACTDRATLADLGFVATSFAYPFSGFNDAAKAAVQECGFNSARLLGDLRSPDGCDGCLPTESIPPADPHAVRAPAQVTDAWTLADLTGLVAQAQSAGSGWMPITFHRVCTVSGCSGIGVTTAILDEFAAYLRAEVDAGRIEVRTTHAVIGGDQKPVRRGDWDPGQVATEGNRLRNPTFEDWPAGASAPTCWQANTWGKHSVTFARADDSAGMVIAVRDYESGSSSLIPKLDLGDCTPAAEPGAQYVLTTTHTSTATTQYAAYLRDARGTWRYWQSSQWFAPSPESSEATWTTPAMPAGTTGFAFGLTLFSNGTLTLQSASMTIAKADGSRPPPVPPKGLSCTSSWSFQFRFDRYGNWGYFLDPSRVYAYDPWLRYYFVADSGVQDGVIKYGPSSACRVPRW